MTGSVSAKYGELIKEAYLQPIRSVLIIDDDYPTLSDIIDTPPNDAEHARVDAKKWHTTQKTALQNLIKQFRSKDPALLIDIHDSYQPTPAESGAVAAHLHQSDLLVLDYNLEPGSDSGAKSITIARELLSNDRFNIIVFHTVNELKPTFQNVLLGLMSSKDIETMELFQSGKELVQNKASAATAKAIQRSIGIPQYLRYRENISEELQFKSVIKKEEIFRDFRSAIDSLELGNKEKLAVCTWAIREFQRTNKRVFSHSEVSELKWSNASSTRFWIRARSGFIAFAKKGEDVSIFSELHETLECWRPEPTRMISARLRAEIDDRGVIAEDITLNNASAFAGVFLNLLQKTNPAELRSELESYLNLQTDQFLDAVKGPVINFAKRLVESERPSKSKYKDKVELFYQVDVEAMKNDVLRNLSAFVCSKPISGWHLVTGHVIKIVDGEEEGYWVCLSPACDLVPEQRKDGIYSDVSGNLMPFMAVQLHHTTSAPEPAAMSSQVFIPIEDGVKQFSFVPSGGNERNPVWKVFLAGSSGKIQDGRKLKVHKMHMGTRKPMFISIEASVVGHLRYEYALNLLNKFASNMSRVGLDFSSISV